MKLYIPGDYTEGVSGSVGWRFAK